MFGNVDFLILLSLGMTIAGGIIIAVACIGLVIGIGLCISMRRKANTANSTPNSGPVMSVSYASLVV